MLFFLMKDLLDVEKVHAKQESHTMARFIFMASFAHLGCLTTFVNLIKHVHFLKIANIYYVKVQIMLYIMLYITMYKSE